MKDMEAMAVSVRTQQLDMILFAGVRTTEGVSSPARDGAD